MPYLFNGKELDTEVGLYYYGTRRQPWYSGSISLIDDIISRGYYFSINSQMTKSENGKKIISKIPLKYVLTETDGPFINENKKTIQPGDICSVINLLSSFWGLSKNDIEREISNNFNKILKQIK